MSEWLARAVTERPGRVLLAALLVTLLALPLALRLRLDTNVYDLFPTSDPVAHAFARFSQSFIDEPVVIVLVESSDATKLGAFVDPFAAELKKSPLVSDVRHRLTGDAARFFRDHLLSLLGDAETQVLADRLVDPVKRRRQLSRVRGLLAAPGGSAMAPLLTADPFELLPLVQKRLGAGVAIDASSGLFKSADGKALLVYLRPAHPGSDPEATRALIADIEAAARPLGGQLTAGDFSGGAGIELAVTGPSIYALSYRDWLHRDMTRSTVLSALAVLVLFGLFFRALRVLPLVGLPLFVGVLWTGALAQLVFHRINAVSLAFGTILIAIGIDLPIQLYNRLREELCAHELREALRITVARFSVPAIVATLGPAAVFAACLVSRFRGLRELGALSALGLVVNCVAMLTIFPALLALVPSRWWGARAVAVAKGGLFRELARLALLRPRSVAAVAIAVGVAALPFATRLRFDAHLFAQPPLMAPSKVQAELERRFGQRDGAAIAYSEQPNEQAALEQSERWLGDIDALEKAHLVDTFQSISLLVPSVSAQEHRWQRVQTASANAPVRAELDALGLDASAFEPFLHQLEGPFSPISPGELPHELGFVKNLHLHDGRIASFFYAPHDAGLDTLDELASRLQRVPGTVVTGKPFLERLLRDMAQGDLARATAVAVLLVVLLVSAYYRRWRPTLAILLPLALAWALFAAVLALFQIPLNLFNLLAVPLVVGYGIDDHVFLVDRYEEHGSIEDALASTGQAILVTSLATMAGFVPLALARFPALRLLGLSGALAVALCLCARRADVGHAAGGIQVAGRLGTRVALPAEAVQCAGAAQLARHLGGQPRRKRLNAVLRRSGAGSWQTPDACPFRPGGDPR